MKALVTVEIMSFWHAGTGLGLGAVADAMVLRDDNGLPYLPGRSLKGLFREGLTVLAETGNIRSDLPQQCLGEATSDQSDNLKSGALFFSNARVSRELENFLLNDSRKTEKGCLYQIVSSTRLDENGMAHDKSLRSIEVCLPLTLQATIQSDIIDTQHENEIFTALQQASGFIKGLGSHRHRGLGRCRVTISRMNEARGGNKI